MIATSYLTPPQIAERYGVDPQKIISWIRRGELRALNVAAVTGGRPRYRISPADLAIFEASRSVQPPAPRVRRRRIDPAIHQFFQRPAMRLRISLLAASKSWIPRRKSAATWRCLAS